MMNAEDVKKALAALKEGNADAALALLESLVASAASGDAGGDAGGEPAASAADAALAEGADAPAPKPEDEEETVAAKALKTLTGTKSLGEAIESLKTMTATVETLRAESAAIELSSRRELIAELVKLGIETPATAWEGKPEDRKPCKRLNAEPVAELRERVKLLKIANPDRGTRGPEAPRASAKSVTKYSRQVLADIKKRGLTIEEFEELKANAVNRHGDSR